MVKNKIKWVQNRPETKPTIIPKDFGQSYTNTPPTAVLVCFYFTSKNHAYSSNTYAQYAFLGSKMFSSTAVLQCFLWTTTKPQRETQQNHFEQHLIAFVVAFRQLLQCFRISWIRTRAKNYYKHWYFWASAFRGPKYAIKTMVLRHGSAPTAAGAPLLMKMYSFLEPGAVQCAKPLFLPHENHIQNSRGRRDPATGTPNRPSGPDPDRRPE